MAEHSMSIPFPAVASLGPGMQRSIFCWTLTSILLIFLGFHYIAHTQAPYLACAQMSLQLKFSTLLYLLAHPRQAAHHRGSLPGHFCKKEGRERGDKEGAETEEGTPLGALASHSPLRQVKNRSEN